MLPSRDEEWALSTSDGKRHERFVAELESEEECREALREGGTRLVGTEIPRGRAHAETQ